MVNAVTHGDFIKIEGADPFEAGNIHAELIRIGPALVVRVDTAPGTEIVLRRHRVELIDAEAIFTGQNIEVTYFCSYCDSATHPAKAAGATACRVETIRQPDMETY